MKTIEKIKLGTLYLSSGCWTSGSPCYDNKFHIGDTFRSREIQWIAVDGKLFADRNICTNISANAVRKYTSGQTIMIDGTAYHCRLPFAFHNPDRHDEWMEAIDKTTTDDAVWNWSRSASWVQRGDSAGMLAVVGKSGPKDFQPTPKQKTPDIGFRPILIPADPGVSLDELVRARVTVITPGEAIYGRLLEYNNYDLFLKADKSLEDKEEKWAVWDDDRVIAVNRDKILHICLRVKIKQS